MWLTFQLIIILLGPWACLEISKRLKVSVLSPVVLCYALGMSIRNLTTIPLDLELSKTIYEASVVLAIPMLLFSTDLMQTLKLAKKSILSFLLFALCVMLVVGVTAYFFNNQISQIWEYVGMYTGICIGGTPNAQSVAIALGSSSEKITLLNGADIFNGAIYLLFLTSLAPRLYASFLPAFDHDAHADSHIHTEHMPFEWLGFFKGLGLTILILAITIGLIFLLYGNLNNQTFLILVLTTLAVLASLYQPIRNLKGPFQGGEYLLLIFCVAVGMDASLKELYSEGADIIGFHFISSVFTIGLHLLLCYLLKIDRDTVMITSAAAFYGPPFIGQVASTIDNKSLIFTGIALGVLGLAVGNYAGVGMAYLMEYFLV